MWTKVRFLDAFSDDSAGNKKLQQSEYQGAGRFPVVDQGEKLIAGYTDDESYLSHTKLPVVVFGDHTRRFKFVDHPFAVGADGVKILAPKPGVDAKYGFHYLRSISLPSAGYSRHFKFLRDVVVPLPPLPEQRRIADILDRADELRAKRRHALALLDSLDNSAFNDMFGDPATNPRAWPVISIGEMAVKFSDGPFGSSLKSSDYRDVGVRVVRLQNIGVGHFNDRDQAFISVEHFQSLRKHECVPGDVLIGTLGDPNLRATIQPEWLDAAINKADCVQLRPNPTRVTAEYVVALINHPSTMMLASGLVLGQTRSRISMGRLRTLRLPIPPIELQRLFANRVQEVHSLRTLHLSEVSKLDEFFVSLQHRVFRGDL